MKVEKNLFSKSATGWFRGLAIVMVILSHYGEWWAWFMEEEGIRELVRHAFTKMGPYGVGIFFLFSGYGLAKSAGRNRIRFSFVVRRIVNVYIPYLVVVLLIEILSGGLGNIKDFIRILYGQDFWYMTVLFSFYLGFMVIWYVFKNTHVRIFLLCCFVFACNFFMQKAGKQNFWYLSNWSFILGTVLALYEEQGRKIMDKIGTIMTIVFGALSIRVVYSGLFVTHVWKTPEEEMVCRIWSVLLFVMFVACFASCWKKYDPVLQIVGKYSLYFYLTHTFIFMTIVNYVETSFVLRFVIATVAIILVSLLLGKVIDLIYKRKDKAYEWYYLRRKER